MSARHPARALRRRPRTVVLTVAAFVSALVTAALLPGWAAAGPAAPTALAALNALNALPPTPNTAWGIDPATGRLMVTVAKAASPAGVARLTGLAERSAGVIEVVRTTEPLTEQDLLGPQAGATLLLGGDQISDGKIICSAGFNVVKDGQPYVLTAGHCTAGMPDWQDVGPSVASSFPKTDFGLIRDDDAASAGDVDLYDGSAQPISTVGTPTVGEHVCASGMATQVTCGEVTALDQTVNYGDGDVVHGLIKTTVHTDHGDSGGPLYDGSAGLGVVSGGDGTTDYFQPLTTAMSAYDLELAEP